MRWRRRRGRSRAGSVLSDPPEDRVGRLERRMSDLEDLAHVALAPDRADDLERRLEQVRLTLPTAEEVLDLRLRTSKVAADLARLATEVRAEVHARAGAAEGADRPF